jgi:hypothetical protein
MEAVMHHAEERTIVGADRLATRRAVAALVAAVPITMRGLPLSTGNDFS